jgi:hypothetical protein
MIMPSADIPTPRTDRTILVDTFVTGMPPILICGAEVVPAHFAKMLERELHVAKFKLKMLHNLSKP